MEEIDQEHMKKINIELGKLGIPPNHDYTLLWMLLKEVKDLNLNIQTLLSKLK